VRHREPLECLAAIARPWMPVSDLSLACRGEVGLGFLPPLVVPTTGSDGYDPGRHPVRGTAVRQSARHRPQRRPV